LPNLFKKVVESEEEAGQDEFWMKKVQNEHKN